MTPHRPNAVPCWLPLTDGQLLQHRGKEQLLLNATFVGLKLCLEEGVVLPGSDDDTAVHGVRRCGPVRKLQRQQAAARRDHENR
jgi:hypothetical protein